jgi:Flp pilus assembly protein TadD
MVRCSPILSFLVVLHLLVPAVADEVDDAIATAWQTFQEGDAEGAIAALSRLTEANPDDVRPNARLAYILLQTDQDPERVFELLKDHIEVHRDDQWALQTVVITAERALSVGRPELARDCAKLLKEARPGEKEYRYLWARASYRLGRQDAVAEACRSLIDDYPSWELPYWLLARTLSDQGEFEAVLQVYRDLLQESPGNVDARLRMARAQLTLRNYERAEESYRSALEIAEPGSALREMAESGIAIVAEERALTLRLRRQSAFLDRLLMAVGGAWAVVVLLLLFVTRRRD